MQILVNGEPREAPEGSTVGDLVRGLGHAGRRLAVEVNADIVPRSEHDTRVLCEGDRVEIVHAIGGG
jgi:sulfur carrier protein